MQPKKVLVQILHVRLLPTDWQAISKTSERLDLGISEIARRALRLGLNVLNRSNLPGMGQGLDSER